MLTLQLPVKALREQWVRNYKDLLHRYGPELASRGFNMAEPIAVERNDEVGLLTLTQEPTGRMSDTNPQLRMLAQRIHRGDKNAVDELYALFLAEGDYRAETLAGLSVDMPENVEVSADFGTKSDSHTTEAVSGDRMANYLLCMKVLVLLGVRQEPL